MQSPRFAQESMECRLKSEVPEIRALTNPHLRIGAFNLQKFGKRDIYMDVDVSHILEQILKRYDLLFLMEPRTGGETNIDRLIKRLKRIDQQNPFDFEENKAACRTHGLQEHYCFFYRSQKLSVLDVHCYGDDPFCLKGWRKRAAFGLKSEDKDDSCYKDENVVRQMTTSSAQTMPPAEESPDKMKFQEMLPQRGGIIKVDSDTTTAPIVDLAESSSTDAADSGDCDSTNISIHPAKVSFASFPTVIGLDDTDPTTISQSDSTAISRDEPTVPTVCKADDFEPSVSEAEPTTITYLDLTAFSKDDLTDTTKTAFTTVPGPTASSKDVPIIITQSDSAPLATHDEIGTTFSSLSAISNDPISLQSSEDQLPEEFIPPGFEIGLRKSLSTINIPLMAALEEARKSDESDVSDVSSLHCEVMLKKSVSSFDLLRDIQHKDGVAALEEEECEDESQSVTELEKTEGEDKKAQDKFNGNNQSLIAPDIPIAVCPSEESHDKMGVPASSNPAERNNSHYALNPLRDKYDTLAEKIVVCEIQRSAPAADKGEEKQVEEAEPESPPCVCCWTKDKKSKSKPASNDTDKDMAKKQAENNDQATKGENQNARASVLGRYQPNIPLSSLESESRSKQSFRSVAKVTGRSDSITLTSNPVQAHPQEMLDSFHRSFLISDVRKSRISDKNTRKHDRKGTRFEDCFSPQDIVGFSKEKDVGPVPNETTCDQHKCGLNLERNMNTRSIKGKSKIHSKRAFTYIFPYQLIFRKKRQTNDTSVQHLAPKGPGNEFSELFEAEQQNRAADLQKSDGILPKPSQATGNHYDNGLQEAETYNKQDIKKQPIKLTGRFLQRNKEHMKVEKHKTHGGMGIGIKSNAWAPVRDISTAVVDLEAGDSLRQVPSSHKNLGSVEAVKERQEYELQGDIHETSPDRKNHNSNADEGDRNRKGRPSGQLPGDEDTTHLERVFCREPFAVRFMSPFTELTEFAVIAIHTDSSSDANLEARAIQRIYDITSDKWYLQNILLAGEFEMDESERKMIFWRSVQMRSDRRFSDISRTKGGQPVLSARDRNCDRFVLVGRELNKSLLLSSAGIFRYDRALRLSSQQAAQVSDHYPIEIQLAGMSKWGPDSVMSAITRWQKYFRAKAGIMLQQQQPVRAATQMQRLCECGGAELPASRYSAFFTVRLLAKQDHTSTLQNTQVVATRESVSDVVGCLKNFQQAFPGILQDSTVALANSCLRYRLMASSPVQGLTYERDVKYDVILTVELNQPQTCHLQLLRRLS